MTLHWDLHLEPHPPGYEMEAWEHESMLAGEEEEKKRRAPTTVVGHGGHRAGGEEEKRPIGLTLARMRARTCT
jgi:hypothetical protein